MKRALIAGFVVLGLAVIGAAVASADVPVPSQDAFYTPPAGYSSSENGGILRTRPITATLASVPLAVHAWQILYRSSDSNGRPTAEVATVMVPEAAWNGPGARPVVSYQTAEDSVGSQCAPSYVIRAGLPGIESNAAPEVGLMAQLLAKGWAVVTSDYEGPDSQFIAAGQEAHGVLDGIRAALADGADGLSAQDPIGLWGYSGGAFATAWATQLAAKYAPELHFTAIAMGGVPSEALPAFKAIDGSYGAGLIFAAVIGLERAFPADFTGLFTTAGAQSLAASGADCTDQILAQYAFQHLSAYTTRDPFTDPKLVSLLNAVSPVGHGAPHAPVYDYHTEQDEFVPVATDNALVAQYCRAGVSVDEVRYVGGDHNTTLLTGAPGAEQFLADRFAGEPAVDTCPAGSAATPTSATHRHHRRRRHRHHRRTARHGRSRRATTGR